MNRRFSLSTLLSKTGGNYILLVIAAAQIIAFPAAFLGSVSIQMNAGFAPEQFQEVFGETPLLVLAGNIILLVLAWILTPNARRRLTLIVRGAGYHVDATQEANAWKEITGLTWRYGIFGVGLAFLVDILLSATFFYVSSWTTQAQYFYTLAGGLVSILAVMIIAVLIIDRLLTPARLALVPGSFEVQINSRSGALLAGKFIALVLALSLIAVLMVAPIGFRNTMLALGHPDDTTQILSNLERQSISIGLITLVIGLGLGYLASHTVSTPIRELINTFSKVEQGDLSQRAPLTATDEIAELTTHFNRMLARLEQLQSTLEKQVSERTSQLMATIEVGSAASAILEPQNLIKKVVNLIADRFGHYYAAIYLLDQTGNWVELMEATGEAGKVLKQNRHRIETNSRNPIAVAINSQKANVMSNISAGQAHPTNPLLPYTRSEIVLPLLVGERILGALDVQSTREEAFTSQGVDTLQGMANQVAIALENARLYQEAQQNLKEMQAIQKQYLQEAWSKVPDIGNLDYSVGDEMDGSSPSIDVPLALRDQHLGSIRLHSDQGITPEEQNLVEAVASQAAIALENARLVNESRLLANRERLVSEISNKIWTSTTIDGVLQTVVRELGRALDTARAVIELKSDDKNE
jgi:GAF domain-containing protein